jgi:serine/threonine protein kinase
MGREIGTYIAPEAAYHTVDAKSDVWALGCVLALLFSWLDCGVGGIEQFDSLRRGISKKEDDRFYQVEEKEPVLSFYVRQWLAELRRRAQERHPVDARLVEEAVLFMENELLVPDSGRRCTARDAEKRLTELWKICLDRPEVEDSLHRPSLKGRPSIGSASSTTKSSWFQKPKLFQKSKASKPKTPRNHRSDSAVELANKITLRDLSFTFPATQIKFGAQGRYCGFMSGSMIRLYEIPNSGVEMVPSQIPDLKVPSGYEWQDFIVGFNFCIAIAQNCQKVIHSLKSLYEC